MLRTLHAWTSLQENTNLYLLREEEEVPTAEMEPPNDAEDETVPIEVELNALTGLMHAETTRLQGKIKNATTKHLDQL